ncbi:uncharacterized protein (TIGR02271 family) [Clostridium punense]|uniref:Uncharacterized protein (TIGR02271 family) n=1 Tax=Clostridium punense TaxID=1054297 RepID=A0ABS4K8I8_9CLOT|nr:MULTISPECIES: YsnF/AvaK domain-containing protein [Clostridium]EQB88886.1 hypothetical protein M918_22780 [Clostridium sp. BL8]MBP2024103.1 uncharacterized protein (TIGR02271 family) [Clostridium punense]
MSIFGSIFGTSDNKSDNNSNNTDNNNKQQTKNDSATLELHKEELDISKCMVQKGEVEIGKEIIEEQKTVDVPVTHEEVVIERRTLNNEESSTPISSEETIRIPVGEEVVDVNKRTVVTGEVSAYKREVEDTQQVSETLKREEAHINKIGNPDVVDGNMSQS